MKTETIDELVFVLTNREQQERLEAAWLANGGTIDEVGEGVKLFVTDGGVVFRTREDRAN